MAVLMHTRPISLRGMARVLHKPTVLLLAVLCLLTGSPSAARAAEPAEYQVKAAFILNFARFVEWPPEALAHTNALVIGVVADDAFSKAIENTVAGKLVDNRPLVVKRLESAEQVPSCHVLFIAQSERARAAEFLEQAGGKPILTVSDLPNFTDTGGMIFLKRRLDTIRFDINLPAAEAHKLKISSKLLKLADNYRR